MKKIIVHSLGVGAVLGALLPAVGAAEPPEPAAAAAKEAGFSSNSAPRTGRVLVLDNENTLTGDIERIDDQYRIKRLIGETWVPAAKAIRLCASLEEAYSFLQKRANLSDADERLRLSDWCRQHNLTSQALAEAEAAIALRPGDAHAKRLAQFLRDMKSRPAAVAAAAPPTKLPPIDVTAESLNVFAARVQPILMNACANCHTAGRGGNFQLIRTYHSGLGDRRSLEQNLAAVLLHVNTGQPTLSRVLTKSVSLHGLGMTAAPLKGRQAPAYLTLEHWVMDTLANNPQLRANAAAVAPPATATAAVSVEAPPGHERVTWGDDHPARAAAVEKEALPLAPPPVMSPTTSLTPPAQSQSNDPVDPGDFNRHFHPERKGGSAE
jgi:hypothetical protein